MPFDNKDTEAPQTPPAPTPEPADGSDQYRTLVDEMGKLYSRMQALVARANEAGEMDAEEEEELARMQKKYDSMRTLKDKNVALLRLAVDSAESRQSLPTIRTAPRVSREVEYRDSFASYLKSPRHMNDLERRALSEGSDSDGGYLPSQEFYGTLQKVIEQAVVFRRIANVINVGTFKTHVAIEGNVAAATWGAEAGTIDATSPTFTQLTLQPRRLSAIALSSIELIEDAPARGPGFSVESIVTDQLGRAFSQAEESAFCIGTAAANKPVGIFTYTSSGIADGKTTAGGAAITANELLDWVYSLPRQYRESKNTAIVTSDAVLGMIRKLAGPGTNPLSYLWQPSFVLGEPDRLCGFPIYASPFAPAVAVNARVAIIGDFSRYHIAQRSSISVKVLRELYAGTGQVGFQAIARMDAGVSVYNAFRYLRMAAS